MRRAGASQRGSVNGTDPRSGRVGHGEIDRGGPDGMLPPVISPMPADLPSPNRVRRREHGGVPSLSGVHSR